MKHKTAMPKAKLSKLCQPFLTAVESVQAIVAERDEAIEKMERMRKWDLKPNSRKATKLPCPRIEFEHVPSEAGWAHRWCMYWLVLPLQEFDIRSENEDGKMGVFRERYIPMGETKSEGTRDEPPIFNGKVETPFRNGAHAKMDREALGLPDLPVYARCDDEVTLIEYKS